MKTKYNINIADPSFTKEDREIIHSEIDKILSDKLSMGSNVDSFEKEFSDFTKAKHAVATNSCTSALEIALKGLGVNSGDEVIVPCQTFIATGMAVHLVGGKPIFCEINKKDLSLDINKLKSLVNNKTKGVILVHFAGYISDDIFKLKDFCNNNNLFLIEDAAHAPGAEIKSKQSGTIGDVGCFSFFPTKVITSGEGGMLITSDDYLANYAKSQQHRGRDLTEKNEIYLYPGRNIRMTEMTAIIGRVQLSNLNYYLERRRQIASNYKKSFKDQHNLKVIAPENDLQSSYWKFPILVSKKVDRDTILNTLNENGIHADATYTPPLHLQPVFRQLYNIDENFLPTSEEIMKRSICLPCHPNISNDEVDYVIKTVKDLLY